MNCPVCGDRGVMRVRYQDGSLDDFGVCLCSAGMALRNDRNAVWKPLGYPLWHVWATREQVDLSRVLMVEQLLDEGELAQIPRGWLPQPVSIAEAMNVNKRPRL
jgi:hypothetical protein